MVLFGGIVFAWMEELVMRRLWLAVFSGRLRHVLVASFSLIAAITVGIGAVATSRAISDYLAEAADERIARDMDLALAFYRIREEKVAYVSQRLALSSSLRDVLPAADQGDPRAVATVTDQVRTEMQVPTITGDQLLLVLGREGGIVVAGFLPDEGEALLLSAGGNWGSLPSVHHAMATGDPVVSTEVVPAEYLVPVGLAGQARVALIDTPKAAPELYDAREGTAGLALIGVAPVKDESGQVAGAVVAMHLFNNDFTLVDRIKVVAGVDTATIFFGDLRVSTNVLDERGERAIGTRISQEVGDQVLVRGAEYRGRAYVVKEWFITRYEPLRDYQDRVVGSLYVGAREAVFQKLVNTFVARILYIALGTILLAALIALPISITVTRPIAALVDAHRRLASGEMNARVDPMPGNGELATLGHSFNAMAETLKSTQEQLVHKERLASVGQLAAGVAHEINNPLGTILLLADVMYKEAREDDARRSDLWMIVEQARRCKGIVFDLLSFARQNRVMAQDTDLNRLVESVVAEEGPKERYVGIQIALELEPRLPIIQADPDQLRQLLVNLMSNAADAMTPQGGTLTLCTRLPTDRRCVELAISDTGCGLSAEAKSRLFTPFFTTKPPGKGTGLGLSIIYGIVKMHRGDIRVDSVEGQGATFTVILPVRLPDMDRPPETRATE